MPNTETYTKVVNAIIRIGFKESFISNDCMEFVTQDIVPGYYYKLSLFLNEKMFFSLYSGEQKTGQESAIIRTLYINNEDELMFILSRVGSLHFMNEQLQVPQSDSSLAPNS